ncbi:DUF2301 domain-containing membrane protein [filamentous cyanobacterium LEGE 11480]|uniref:DUF2301 domain-containing membrane protein n=1 Tax=Romeriopsis navalis LEGE 11480 TaxID=2777977 RepID=A0A928Z568_9CYAN|nr:DUF2301 domain-containing membrane protein [Romeriopsis navalis]MBE9031727.1 DUF2301 domain-containing membrane protein [Romeriopsis navalis LEGE 11480]
MTSPAVSETYAGHFGPFTITDADRREVVMYRSGLAIAAGSLALGVGLFLGFGSQPIVLTGLAALYGLFWLGLGVSLWKIHIYMRPLHMALQIFWAIGGVASLVVAFWDPRPFILTLYEQPLWILGVGFTFAALTGIFFKEAFCFNRFETKFLTPLVPGLLLGHMAGILPVPVEQGLLVAWAILLGVFALRKSIQAIPDDIGDKSVFEHLEQQRNSPHAV